MQPYDFKRIRTALQLTHNELAGVLKIDRRTVFRYESNETPVGRPAGQLMRALEAAPQLVALLSPAASELRDAAGS
jgi:DNA-binding transcriptional regulator YiaG